MKLLARYIFTIVALMAFAFGAFSADNLSQLNSRIDVLHYKFTLDVQPTNKWLEGVADIRIKITSNEVMSFELDLDDMNSDGSGMLVTGVNCKSHEVRFSQNNDKLIVDISPRLNKDDEIELSVIYKGRPADGLIIKQSKFKEVTAFGDNWPNRARHWLPVVDHPSDKATVEWLVTAPKNYSIIANGKLLQANIDKNKRSFAHWKMETPIPTKVMVIGLAEFVVHRNGTVGATEVTTWSYKKSAKDAEIDFSNATKILNVLTEWIGEFPYEKLAHVQSTTRYGGMENAGNIFYYENAITGQKSIDRLIAHETAHMWFGNSTSEKEWPHVWLSEGFATYMTMIFVEEAMGVEEMREDMARARGQVLRFADKQPNSSIIDTTIVDLPLLLNANSYQKGAWFLHMLRQKVGDDVFKKSIRQYYSDFKHGNALTDDFRAIVETIYGQKLDTFFIQWLYRPGVPEIEWSWAVSSQSPNRVNIALRQVQPLRYEGIFIDIDVYMKDNPKPVRRNVEVIYNTKEISIMAPSEVHRVVLDPECKLLFKEKKIAYDR